MQTAVPTPYDSPCDSPYVDGISWNFLLSGDSSADDSSASTATNEVKVKRRASITRQEAENVMDSLARQQEDRTRQ